MVAPLLGLIATSVTPPDRARPESALDRIRPYLDGPNGLDVLKVVTGWGLGTAWTEATRRAACRIPRRGIVVRTVHGDLSAYGGRHEYLHPEHVEAEITPWWDARDPDRLFAIELGNEPLLHPEPSDERAHAYAHYLGLTIAMCRERFPGARLIGPAHTLNEPIRVGAVADGQELWTQICAPQLRQCDALAIHAYTLHQYLRGIKLCRTHVGAHPVWVTEFALNEAMPDDIRGRRYAEVIRQFAVEGVCLYHLDEVGGEDPIHFNPNYALNLPTVRALAQAWRQGDAAPAPAPPARPAVVSVPMTRDRLSRGRPLGPPRLLVMHATAGRGPGDLGWLRKGGGDPPLHPVSCHYYISKAGRISQLVADHDTAWHCGPSAWVVDGKRVEGSHQGVSRLNWLAIGIELENLNTGKDRYPEVQVAAAIALARHLVHVYQIPPAQLVRHLDISPGRKTDPANFPWGSFAADVYLGGA